MGNTGSGNRLGLRTDDAGENLANAGWGAYNSQAARDSGLRIPVSYGATSKVDLLEENSEVIEGVGYSHVNSPAFDSLTRHFEAL